MKKFTILFVIFLCLSFNRIGLQPAFAVANMFKQGIYQLSDLNFSQNNTYTISDSSSTNSIFVIILNENQVIIQALRLGPNSGSYETLPITPGYRIVILGKGEATIIPTPPKH